MILVIGATGYIGRYLCPFLNKEASGEKVLALGRSKQGEKFLKEHGVEFRHFDITEADPFAAISDIDPAKISAIVYLSSKLPEFEVPVEDFFAVNTIGVYKTLEFARQNGIDKVVITSSHKVYNDINDKEVITPEDGPEFRGSHSPYIISKIAAENFVKYYNKDYGMHAIVLRLTGVHGYGELMGQLNNDGSYRKSAFEWFFEKALNGEDIEVWGDPQRRRDHVYIKDVIRAIDKAIHAKDAKGIYNVSSGVGYTQYEEAQVIAELLAHDGKKSKVTLNKEKPGLERGYVYDISKTRKELGWEPEFVDLEKMYTDYLEEWRKKEYHNFHEYSDADRPATA